MHDRSSDRANPLPVTTISDAPPGTGGTLDGKTPQEEAFSKMAGKENCDLSFTGQVLEYSDVPQEVVHVAEGMVYNFSCGRRPACQNL